MFRKPQHEEGTIESDASMELSGFKIDESQELPKLPRLSLLSPCHNISNTAS